MTVSIRTLLLTGSAGHAGAGIAAELSRHYRVKGMDLRPSDSCAESLVGSVTDLGTCRRAVAGVDAVVMSHMGRNPTAYEPPFEGIDINVRGTTNLYQACVEAGICRVVLISSASIFGPDSDRSAPPGACRYGPGRSLYPVTKAMQEMLAYHYYDRLGIVTQAIRPSWIVYEADLRHKRGTESHYQSGIIDPADIAQVVHLCLQRDANQLEAYTVGQPEYPGVADTMDRLGWEPRHTFIRLREAAMAQEGA